MTLFVMLSGQLPFARAVDPVEHAMEEEATEGDRCASTEDVGVGRCVSQAQAAICENAICDQPLRFPSGGHATLTAGASVSSGDGSVGPSVSSGDGPGGGQPGAATEGGVISTPARALLAAMLTKDPACRATLALVAQHPWVSRGGAEPLLLPQVDEPLCATPEEVHRAISIRAPALDLAGSHGYSRYERSHDRIAPAQWQSHPPTGQTSIGGAGAAEDPRAVCGSGMRRLRSM